MWYIYIMKYYLAKKKKDQPLTHNSDESQMHYTEWKQPESKDYLLYDSIYMAFWKDRSKRTENRWEFCRGWEWGVRSPIKGTRNILGGNGNVLHRLCWWFHDCMHLSKLTEIRKNILYIYKLYFNKSD